MYSDKTGDVVNEHNNRYYSTIKIKSDDVKSSSYIDYDPENNDKDPKFEAENCERIFK